MAVKKVKDKRSLAKNWQQTKLNLVEKRHQFPYIISYIWICLQMIMTYSSKGYYDDKLSYDIIKTLSHISEKIVWNTAFFLQDTRIYLDNPCYKSTFVYEDECKLH